MQRGRVRSLPRRRVHRADLREPDLPCPRGDAVTDPTITATLPDDVRALLAERIASDPQGAHGVAVAMGLTFGAIRCMSAGEPIAKRIVDRAARQLCGLTVRRGAS